MLNPKVAEVYGDRTAECFQFLSDAAERKNAFVGLHGIKGMKGVVLPCMVYMEEEDLELVDMVDTVFINRAVSLTMLEQDAIDYLPSVRKKHLWEDIRDEVIPLWVS